MKSAMTKPSEPGSMNIMAAYSDEQAVAALDPIQREAFDWIARFMGATMTPADVAALKAWYGQSPDHAAAYAQARRMWTALGPVANARMGARGEDPLTLRDGMRSRAIFSAPMGRRAFMGGALAACAAYGFVNPPLDLWPSYSELSADYRTGAGEQRQVALTDAISLDLNTKTSIAVRSHTADSMHIELIAGEAAVSARADSSELTVVAAAGRIVASRSDFNLRCDGSRVFISCLSGTLLVLQNGSTTKLAARQHADYGDREISGVTAFDPDYVTAWRQGKLVFDKTPVAQVIAEVNRYRAHRIVLVNSDIGRRLLTARLPTTETDKIVTQIVHIFGAKARTLPGGMIVLS
jgi:transmembrane sensor